MNSSSCVLVRQDQFYGVLVPTPPWVVVTVLVVVSLLVTVIILLICRYRIKIWHSWITVRIASSAVYYTKSKYS